MRHQSDELKALQKHLQLRREDFRVASVSLPQDSSRFSQSTGRPNSMSWNEACQYLLPLAHESWKCKSSMQNIQNELDYN